MILLLRGLLILSLFAGVVFTAGAQVQFNAADIKGPLCVVYDTVNKKTLTMSPAQSQYNVVISDGYAQLTLIQKFINPGLKLRSIIYVFPLPDNGSVTAMQMEYKNKLYKASICERKKAQQIYDSVSALGQAAALLLQDRPNVFQQSLANIEAGDSAFVQIKVTLPLKYNNGEYELARNCQGDTSFKSDRACIFGDWLRQKKIYKTGRNCSRNYQ